MVISHTIEKGVPMLFKFLTFLCFFFPMQVVAQAQVSDFMLDNGMQVVVIEDHRAPVVVQMVWYKVGAADEAPGKSGIAHFLEHLMFKKTDNLASGELSDTVAANGGSDNAFTNQDYTGYYQRVAADRLELVMKMEADRMTGLQLSVDDIATERDVVIEERNQRTESTPGALFNEQKQAALYMNHNYGIPVIGWMHELEKLNFEDAVAFYKRHYAPNNAILVVAGDVTPAQVKILAEQYYGAISANLSVKPRQRTQEPPQRSARRMTYYDERVAQPYVSRIYLAPERDRGDQKTAAALVYLAEILGGSSATSILGKELQFDTQKAVYTSAYYSGVSLDNTTFGLIAVPVPDVSLQEVENAMDSAKALGKKRERDESPASVIPPQEGNSSAADGRSLETHRLGEELRRLFEFVQLEGFDSGGMADLNGISIAELELAAFDSEGTADLNGISRYFRFLGDIFRSSYAEQQAFLQESNVSPLLQRLDPFLTLGTSDYQRMDAMEKLIRDIGNWGGKYKSGFKEFKVSTDMEVDSQHVRHCAYIGCLLRVFVSLF